MNLKANLTEDNMQGVAALLLFTSVLSLLVLIYSIVKRRAMKSVQADVVAKTVEPAEDGFVKIDNAAKV